MHAAFTITAKDLKERFRDRSAIMLAVVVPLGLAFILNLTLGPVTEQSFTTEVAVHDADAGEIAHEGRNPDRSHQASMTPVLSRMRPGVIGSSSMRTPTA